MIDGTDLRDVTSASVRRAVTLLPQQSRLFRASIRDNIAYGRPDADEAAIVQAARDAGAHDFITALPGGYRTSVGEDGFQPSGGQRQRIAIARPFLRATPVLVLDEPTAGLDEEVIDHLMGPLRRLMAGRTTVLITHDRRVAERADSIYLLPAAAVSAPGTGPDRSADGGSTGGDASADDGGAAEEAPRAPHGPGRAHVPGPRTS